jgi:hypothetical protein
MAALSLHAASLQVFAVVYGQVTNDISYIQADFENSPEEKQKLARLVATRSAILNPTLSDAQALAKVVDLLAPETNYAPLVDEVAGNARAALISRYFEAGERIDLLAPSKRTTQARNRYAALAADFASLNNPQHAGGIVTQLTPFSRALDSLEPLIARAAVLPRPNIHGNAVRAIVNGKLFSSSGTGGSSPNLFVVTAPTPLYLEVSCRVVDRERVITFAIPVLTEQKRYDVETSLAALSFTPDVFAVGATPIDAASGTFWVQTVKDEVYGIFSCSGPGLEIKDGRFRIKFPPALRE